MAYELVVVRAGRLLGFLHGSHEGCREVERGAVSFGSVQCSEEAGRRNVALRESMVVRRGALVPGSSSLVSLATMTSMGCMWRVY